MKAKKTQAKAKKTQESSLPPREKLSAIGAFVGYCGHDACFIADIIEVGDAVVVVANGPIEKQLIRPAGEITHRVIDFPTCGYWGKNRGVFVVPRAQVTLVGAKP